MRITDIEVIPIYPRLAKRYEKRKVSMHRIDHRTVFKVHTDIGLVGYGDQRFGPGMQRLRSSVEPRIGRNPFDFINNHLT